MIQNWQKISSNKVKKHPEPQTEYIDDYIQLYHHIIAENQREGKNFKEQENKNKHCLSQNKNKTPI